MVGTKWMCIKAFEKFQTGDICTVVYQDGNQCACVGERHIGGHMLGAYGAPVCEDGHGWWVYEEKLKEFFVPADESFYGNIEYDFDDLAGW